MDPTSLQANVDMVISMTRRLSSLSTSLKSVPKELRALLDELILLGKTLHRLVQISPDLSTILSTIVWIPPSTSPSTSLATSLSTSLATSLSPSPSTSPSSACSSKTRSEFDDGSRKTIHEVCENALAQISSVVDQISSGTNEWDQRLRGHARHGLIQKHDLDKTMRLVHKLRLHRSSLDTVISLVLRKPLPVKRNRAGLKRLEICPHRCDCRCHISRRISIPCQRSLTQIVGQLHGSSIGLPSGFHLPYCTYGDDRYTMTLGFRLPSWLLPRACDFTISYRNGRFSLGCLVYTTLQVDAILSRIADGDTAGLDALIWGGTFSPHGIDSDLDTYLHKAVKANHALVCELLLDAGVDPYALNFQNKSAADLAWDKIISGSADHRLQDIFSHYDKPLLEHRFSTIQLVVLALSDLDLETEIQNDQEKIDHLDVTGRSALYWAVRRGDEQAAALLLRYHASPSAGASAIAWACRKQFKDANCLQLLLTSGADPDGHDSDGHTALHACGISGRDRSFISCLVTSGATIDLRYQGESDSYRGMTALGFACFYSWPVTIRLLLEYGADPNICDDVGRCPLHLSLTDAPAEKGTMANSTIVSLLLQANADIEFRSREGFSPANLAMRRQDIDSLSLLLDAGANIVYPTTMGPSSNGYCMLSWPVQNRWHTVVSYLLAHPKVNVRDKDPKSGRTVLHLLAEYADQRTVTIFEEAVGYAGFNPNALDNSRKSPTFYMNEELRRGTAFSDLQYRMQVLYEGSYKLARSLDYAAEAIQTVKGEATTQNDSRVFSSERKSVGLRRFNVLGRAGTGMGLVNDDPKAMERPTAETLTSFTTKDADPRQIPRQPSLQPIVLPIDEEIQNAFDSDDEITLTAWHPRVHRRTKKIYSDAHDSGYTSEGSMYSDETNDGSSFTSASSRKEPVKAVVWKTCKPESSGRISMNTLISEIISSLLVVHQALWSLASMMKGFRDYCKKSCIRIMRPRTLKGYTRITWQCHCGTELYADFPSADGGAIKELSDALSSPTNVTTPSGESHLQMPTSISSPSGNSASRSKRARNQGNSSPPVVGQCQGPSDVTQPISTPQFLELCINTGNYCQSLAEIVVTRIDTDSLFFHYVRQQYREVRGWRLKKHFLVKPVAMEFVYFGLERNKTVHIFQKPSIPTKKDVNAKEWQYCPCPLRPPSPMPSSTFIHYLSRCSEDPTAGNGKSIWLDRLPKKLNEPLKNTAEDLAMAWGLHIIEGPDMTMIVWVMLCVLAICFGPVIAYVVLRKDVQGATGIGGLYVSTLTLLWMVMKVSEWRDG